jgi:lipid A ethanolaminephosphotransferase
MPFNWPRLRGREISSGGLILAVAVFIAIVANGRFYSAALSALGSSPWLWPFHLSLFCSLVALLVLILSAICHRALVKPVLIAFLLISAVVSYFAIAYGTVVDEEMIANALQTDGAEAGDLVSPTMLTWIGFVGVLPGFAVWRAKLVFPDWRTETVSRLKLAGAALAVLAGSVVAFSGHYAGLLRFHGEVTNQAVPTYALLSAIRLAAKSAPKSKHQHIELGTDAALPPRDRDHELIIMVVGETLRADHFGLNGYARDTTPQLRSRNVVNFPDFWSCGTATAVSVPCMFSNLGRAKFKTTTAATLDNALDVLARAGVSILWRDNNSSSKGVADRVTYQDFKKPPLNPMCEDGECRDEGMLAGLQDWINAQQGDMLIVLHQMGNHGPAYYKRYPKAFEKFTPICPTSDLGSCTAEELNNTYDNAALYTDHFLSKVIDLLKANDHNYETAMFYVSDHGESLGEHGLYLHGAPYVFAPDTQKHVPAVMWLGQGIKEDVVMSSVADRSRRPWSHDNVFSTLLGFFEVTTVAYDPKLDILERTHVETSFQN